MYILNKEGTEAFNSEHICNIFISKDNAIRAAMKTRTTGGYLGQYDSLNEAKTALKILIIRLGDGFQMPDSMSIKAEVIRFSDKTQRINGKKQKGHGGS